MLWLLISNMRRQWWARSVGHLTAIEVRGHRYGVGLQAMKAGDGITAVCQGYERCGDAAR